MEVLFFAILLVWLLVETHKRIARDKSVQTELAILRQELAALKGRGAESAPATPVAPASFQRGPIPAARAQDATAPVVVPDWIRNLPEPVRPAPAVVPERLQRPAPAEPAASAALPGSPAEAPAPLPRVPLVPPPLPRIPYRPAPAPAPAPPQPPSRPFDWESLIGVKLFSYIAGIAMLVAAVAFLRYSIDNGWLRPEVRMSIGILVGLGLLAGCETRRARAYAITAQSLTGAGIATLFSTFYAATALWSILPGAVAFLLMALVTAVAVALSIRRDSVFIALLGLVGGFATPMLLATGQDHPIGLFGYLALLNTGLAWVAYRKRWPVLTALTLGCTALYQAGWVFRFLAEAKLGIALGVFLLFPALAFGAMLLARQRDPGAEMPNLFRHATCFTALPPLLFALHLAANPVYGQHFALMFGFLLLVAAGLAAIALFHGPEWLHALGAAGVLGVFLTWLGRCYRAEAWPWMLGFTGLFLGLYLVVPWLQARLEHKRPFTGVARLAVYTAPLLLFVFPVLAWQEPATAAPALLFIALVALLALLAAFAVRFQEGWVYFLGCGLTLVAEAVWSHRHLNPANLEAALVIYAGFALLFLAVPAWARRRGRALLPAGSGAVLAFACLPLLLFLVVGPVCHGSLGILAIMLVLLNLALLFEAAQGRHPVLSLLGMLASWGLLGIWWAGAIQPALLLPALLVLAGFALLVLGGRCWLRNRAGADSLMADQSGLLLGLVGHLFLVAVVVSPGLAVSPWPWLAVLLVLDLALAAAALYHRRGEVRVGAALLTQVVLVAWVLAAVRAPGSGLIALWASLGLALLGLGWFELGRRRGLDLTVAAALGLLASHVLVLVLKDSVAAPGFVPNLVVQVALAVAMLALAWRSGRHAWALALALASVLVLANGWGENAIGVGAGSAQAAWHLLGLAGPLYLLQLVYPLALGDGARKELLPFLAAVLASAFFFLLARPAIEVLVGTGAIGMLPVLQALLLVPHLVRLLRLQPPEQRELGRLALVAGGILGFITVAIPLQLDKEWVTLGWALLGLALVWLYGRVPHKGLLLWAGGLLAVVFVRLALNPALLDYHPRSPIPVLNWYLYTYLVAAGCCLGAARLLNGRDDRLATGLPRLRPPLLVAAAVLLFLLLNIEIADGFSSGPALTFNLAHGSLAQDLSYTLGWAVYAVLLLVTGILARNRASRVAAILLLTVTVFKAFLHDLARLQGLYRVGSFVGLALSLALVAVILQKFVLRRGEETR